MDTHDNVCRSRPVLVAMTGLPATGKSALATALAACLRCPTYSVDPLEAVLLRGGITRAQRSDYLAYDLAAYCAEEQLRHGQPAVVDAVNALATLQDGWVDIARRNDADFRLVYTVCSDPRCTAPDSKGGGATWRDSSTSRRGKRCAAGPSTFRRCPTSSWMR
jgi:predicted kinase